MRQPHLQSQHRPRLPHRRGLFGKRPYCSKQCRDDFAVAPATKCERATTYFEWLFMQPATLQPRMAVAAVRLSAR
jgi:hypothetical protein